MNGHIGGRLKGIYFNLSFFVLMKTCFNRFKDQNVDTEQAKAAGQSGDKTAIIGGRLDTGCLDAPVKPHDGQQD